MPIEHDGFPLHGTLPAPGPTLSADEIMNTHNRYVNKMCLWQLAGAALCVGLTVTGHINASDDDESLMSAIDAKYDLTLKDDYIRDNTPAYLTVCASAPQPDDCARGKAEAAFNQSADTAMDTHRTHRDYWAYMTIFFAGLALSLGAGALMNKMAFSYR